MKICRFFALLLCVFSLTGFAAADALASSEVYLENNHAVKVSARNFDFVSGDGYVRFSPAGMAREAQHVPQGCQPLKWTSQYASISFNKLVYKTNSPVEGVYDAGVDGLNQAGLKIGTYFLESSGFAPDGPSTTLDIATLMQYLLDNFKNVNEALADLDSGRYRVTSTPATSLEVKLHLFLHDASGASAIVEFINGKTKITRAPQLPVLTNSVYAESLEHLKNFDGFGGQQAIPGANESLDRFVRGAFYKKHLDVPDNTEEAVNDGFAVVQTLSVSPKFPHGCTQWTIVTDIDNRRVYFRTLNNPSIACIDLGILVNTAKVSSDINLLRTDLSGDITGMFDKADVFNAAATPKAADYNNKKNWASLPSEAETEKPVDVFFVLPTTFFFPNSWNLSIEESRQDAKVGLNLTIKASVFSKACNIYAPHYRQANFKVLSSSEENKTKALEVAYSDVEKAFDYYMTHFNHGRPFILAGHSQGSNLLLWLMQRRFSNPELREKLVASYLIGWSVTKDDLEKYPQLKMSAAPDQVGSIISYNTQNTDHAMTIVRPGAVGVNPLTMDMTSESISKDKNLGAVFFTGADKVEIANFTGAQTIDGALIIPKPTRVDLVQDADSGFYHPYDYTFFYRNIEKNVSERISAYMKQHPEAK